MAKVKFAKKMAQGPKGESVIVVAMTGSIDASTIQGFSDAMDDLLAPGAVKLVVDMSNVKYINSTGLGTLLKYTDAASEDGGGIIFCNVSSKVMLVMEMLGFNALFAIMDTEEQAVNLVCGESAPEAQEAPEVVVALPRILTPASAGVPSIPSIPSAAPSIPSIPKTTFPVHSNCALCSVTLVIGSEGKFKCPRCNAVMILVHTVLCKW